MAAAFPKTLLLLDKAYGKFSGRTAIHLATKYSNIIVARTFSKAYGLAGLRIGYVIATPGNIARLNLIRNGKNVSMIGQVAAVAALQDQEYLQASVKRLRKGQEILVAALTRLGIEHHDTPANFVLIKFADAPQVVRELAVRHIYVRPMSHLKGLNGFLRITVGDGAQMSRLVQALEEIL